MQLLSVTDLSGILYCQRAVYLKRVLGIVPPVSPAVVKGNIRHEVYDRIGLAEEKIMLEVTEKTSRQEILSEYKKHLSYLLRDSILQRKELLLSLGMVPGRFFLEVWPYLLEESEERADRVFSFAEKERLFGESLIAGIEPKVITELSVQSDKLMLKGIIDKVEVYKGKQYKPYELKTGSAPKEGIWPGHRVQLAAYILLLRQKFNSEICSGVLHYLDAGKRHELIMNPFMEEEVNTLTQEAIKLLSSPDIPQRCPNTTKCVACGLKHTCKNAPLLQKIASEKLGAVKPR